jgi:acyl-CoA synthetase (AMP-forming)/AMP-acid ligase II
MIFRSPWPDIELPSCSICDAILGTASRHGDKLAVIEGDTGRTLTYRQLSEGVDRVAAGLSHAGLQPRQPLAVVLPNCIDFTLAWFGALRAGAWVVPINPLYTPAEMQTQIQDSGARYAVTIPECAAALEALVDHVFVTDGNWNEILQCNAPPPDVRPNPDDLAAMPYSSGTTGKPKGVMLTHANILTNIRQLEAVAWVRQGDVIVNTFPLYHAAGLNGSLNAFLTAGATLVLMRRFDLQLYLALNERYCATFFGGPPPLILALTKSPECADFQFDRLKRAACGAAPLGAELHEAFEQRTGVLLGQVWGMSEATAVISATPNDRAKRKFGSCGYLLPSSEAQVVDTVSLKPLGVGETGEIWVRGPQLMNGYWKQPEATAETFPGDGWMRTGDIGYFDADGCVFLVDRLKEFIKYKAYQVAPAELEDVIQSHPAVHDAAVIGAPDEAAGEIPMAFVVKKRETTLDAGELMQYVAARVAPYKKIRAVEFVNEIPKSPAGKILRRVLKEGLRTRHAASS